MAARLRKVPYTDLSCVTRLKFASHRLVQRSDFALRLTQTSDRSDHWKIIQYPIETHSPRRVRTLAAERVPRPRTPQLTCCASFLVAQRGHRGNSARGPRRVETQCPLFGRVDVRSAEVQEARYGSISEAIVVRFAEACGRMGCKASRVRILPPRPINQGVSSWRGAQLATPKPGS